MNSDIFEYKKEDGDKNEIEFDDGLDLGCVDFGDESFSIEGGDFEDIELELEVTSPSKAINRFLPPSKIPSFKTGLFSALKLGVDFKTFFDFEAKKQGWEKGDVVHIPLSMSELDLMDAHNTVGRLRIALTQAEVLEPFFSHREHVMRPMNLRAERVISPLVREANHIAKLMFTKLINRNEQIDIDVIPSLYSDHRNIIISDRYFVHSVDLVSLIPDLLLLISETNYPLEQLSMNFTDSFEEDKDHQQVLADFDKHGLSFWREGNSNRMLKVFVYNDEGSVSVKEIKIKGQQPRKGTMLAENRPYSTSVMKHLSVFNSAVDSMQDDALSVDEANSLFESIPWKFRCREKPYFIYDSSIEAFVIKV
ncbi:TPA: hypothetical protein NKQ70_004670 [Vibrio parahaemolyticus]|uniref:hypothetical protein n=1 Tax=Vibrio antiquarius (strain Ex25) TaxID=150340 RepID=UPI002659D51D|nr:hypothetical protein [Vibrio antiquarius]MCE9842647.1 hypothetical protein [Vibrio antiquarius]HCH1832896.1 hypothetical protein [Vibrio parahaemolyticus]